MGEVDDADHAENERQPNAQEGVAPQEKTYISKEPQEGFHPIYLLKGASKSRAMTAGPSGYTVTSLRPRHCMMKVSARMFWPESSNFTPQPLAVLPGFPLR